jgi:hypothetical protein
MPRIAIDRGEVLTLATFYQEPPPGALETILKAIQGSMS